MLKCKKCFYSIDDEIVIENDKRVIKYRCRLMIQKGVKSLSPYIPRKIYKRPSDDYWCDFYSKKYNFKKVYKKLKMKIDNPFAFVDISNKNYRQEE